MKISDMRGIPGLTNLQYEVLGELAKAGLDEVDFQGVNNPVILGDAGVALGGEWLADAIVHKVHEFVDFVTGTVGTYTVVQCYPQVPTVISNGERGLIEWTLSPMRTE